MANKIKMVAFKLTDWEYEQLIEATKITKQNNEIDKLVQIKT